MIKLIVCYWIFIVVKGNEIYKNFAEKGSCGKAFAISLRIVGGEHAKRGEFPWIVSITRRGGHICGGTIISEKFVVTAAHCLCSGLGEKDFFSPSNLKVTVGQYNLVDSISDAYKIRVESIIVHSGYTCSIAKNDIALLELKNKVIWSNNVAPICVSTTKNREEYDQSLVTVAGWGWTSEDSVLGKRSDKLRKASVRVIETDTCRKWYAEQKKHLTILESHICAGHKSGGVDACWADSGGPLMKHTGSHNDPIMIIGIVSTGRGCGRAKLPGIYTRISDYIEWIEDQITKLKTIKALIINGH